MPVGSIRGRVLGLPTQEPVPGAIVLLLRTTLGAAADENGHFTITGVPVGTYQLRASAVGREPTIVADVVVAAGRSVDLLIRLEELPVGIEEVEVRGKYFQKTPDAPVSAQRLSYEEIRRSPGGFEDVVRTISVFPGVAQALPGRNDLVVRGGAPSENLFVVDNVEIPNINHFGTLGSGGGPLSYINLDFVRETAFSTGGFGVRYGDRLSSASISTVRSTKRVHSFSRRGAVTLISYSRQPASALFRSTGTSSAGFHTDSGAQTPSGSSGSGRSMT
jgi:hypothetical protein